MRRSSRIVRRVKDAVMCLGVGVEVMEGERKMDVVVVMMVKRELVVCMGRERELREEIRVRG